MRARAGSLQRVTSESRTRHFGDIRDDGYFFWGYRKEHGGLLKEVWYSPEAWERARSGTRLYLRRKRAEMRQEDRDEHTRKVKEWSQKDYRKRMFHRAKSTALGLGIPFGFSDYTELPNPTHCPVFGVEFVYGGGPWSASIDRVVPSRGYVPGNVVVVSKRANQIKSDAGPGEILKVAKYYEKLFKKLKIAVYEVDF